MAIDAGWQEAIDASEARDWEDPPAKKKHAGGRPKGRFDASIDWATAEKIFVEGEIVDGVRLFPTQTAIARRTGTTIANFSARVLRYNWKEKKRKFLLSLTDIPAAAGFESLPQPPPQDLENPRKRSRRSPEKILEAYIEAFAKAVDSGDVRHDSVADLDKAVRLLAFVRGQADSTKQVHHTVTLDVMQQRHKALRTSLASADDVTAGVLGQGVPGAYESDGEAIDTEGVPVDEGNDALPVDPFE
jgi:hypothetical protein